MEIKTESFLKIGRIVAAVLVMSLCAVASARPGKLYALVIGVDKYDNLAYSQSSPSSESISKISDALANGTAFGPANVVVLTGVQRALRADIVARLQEIASNAKAEDTFIFYFAGAVASGDKQHFLAAADTSPDDLQGTGVGINDLIKIFGTIKAKQSVCLFDVAPLTTKLSWALDELSSSVSKKTGSNGYIFSCSANQTPSNGAFAEVLSRAFSGDAKDAKGVLGFNGLCLFLTKELKLASKPQPYFRFRGSKPIVLGDGEWGVAPTIEPLPIKNTNPPPVIPPKPLVVQVQLATDPPGATATIDGKAISGTTPIHFPVTVVPDKPTKIKLVLNKEGYQPLTTEANIEAGKPAVLQITLAKIPVAIPATIALVRKAIKGDIASYKVESELTGGFQKLKYTGVISEKVIASDASGSVILEEQTVEALFWLDGKSVTTEPEPPVTTTYGPTGEVSSAEGKSLSSLYYRVANLTTFRFPTKPISPGDTWKYENQADKERNLPAGTAQFRVREREAVGAFSTMRIQFQYTEEGTKTVSTGTFWINITDGSLVKGVYDVQNMPVESGPAVNAHILITRIK